MASCADGHAQPDFAGSLGHGDQHDVDDADRTESERHQADPAEEYVHRVEDFAHHLL